MTSVKKTQGSRLHPAFETKLNFSDLYNIPELQGVIELFDPTTIYMIPSLELRVVSQRRGRPSVYVYVQWPSSRPSDWFKIIGNDEELQRIFMRFNVVEGLQQNIKETVVKFNEYKHALEVTTEAKLRIEQWLVFCPVKPAKPTEKPTGQASESVHNTVPGVSSARGLGQV